MKLLGFGWPGHLQRLFSWDHYRPLGLIRPLASEEVFMGTQLIFTGAALPCLVAVCSGTVEWLAVK